MIYICNFHVLSHLLLIYICKLHWNQPLLSGGGQERGLRSGTLSPALCVGMGAAARICADEMERDGRWVTFLAEKLKRGVMARIPQVLTLS